MEALQPVKACSLVLHGRETQPQTSRTGSAGLYHWLQAWLVSKAQTEPPGQCPDLSLLPNTAFLCEACYTRAAWAYFVQSMIYPRKEAPLIQECSVRLTWVMGHPLPSCGWEQEALGSEIRRERKAEFL